MPDDRRIRNIYIFNTLVGCTNGPHDPMSLANFTYEKYLTSIERSKDEFGDPLPLLLVVDQFEELFTMYPERWNERREFLEQVGKALEDDRALRVLFSMREEYIGELDPYVSLLPDKSPRRFRLEGLNERAALVCVTSPLQSTGKSFAPGVAETLVEDLLSMRVQTISGMMEIKGQFVEPVQLQVVCQSLWNSLDPTTTEITKSHLERFGNVDQSLDSFYEQVIARTVEHTGINESRLRRWFETALITPAGTRAVVFRGIDNSEKLPNRVIDELEKQYIIKPELRGGQRWYELSHDRFIDVIKNSNRRRSSHLTGADAEVSRLEQCASEWIREGRKRTQLLNVLELARAEAWLAETGEDYSETLLAFIQASEVQRLQRQRRLQLSLTILLVILLVLTVVYLLLKIPILPHSQNLT
jgi:DNA-binding transcriptional MerR regulator